MENILHQNWYRFPCIINKAQFKTVKLKKRKDIICTCIPVIQYIYNKNTPGTNTNVDVINAIVYNHCKYQTNRNLLVTNAS
jgi:hypothetical protein